jgi:DNA primase
MAKTYLNTVKYEISAKYEITGIVEKPDIIGAIFGQSEGLLGQDMDLKELQQNGKLGRIEITVKKGKGTTSGEIIIPSSLDQVKTSILAATIESVDKVGPCEATIKIGKISDTRKEKRDVITDRAKELLKKMQKFEGVESEELAETIKAGVRKGKVSTLNGLTVGPDAKTSNTIVVVEGRADVLKLLSYGINDVVAMNGSNISKALIDLCKEKEVTMLVDGDRGGDLNAKKLTSLTNVNYVAKAPDGKEVEELTQKEILQALKRRIPASEIDRETRKPSFQKRNDFRGNDRSHDRRPSFRGNDRNSERRPSFRNNSDSERRPSFRSGGDSQRRSSFRGNDRNPRFGSRSESFGQRFDPFKNNFRGPAKAKVPETRVKSEVRPVKETSVKPRGPPKEILALEKDFSKIKGKLKARFFDKGNKKIKDVDVKSMIENLEKSRKKVDTIMFDGIITKRLLDVAEAKNVKNVIGVRKGTAKSDKVKTFTM